MYTVDYFIKKFSNTRDDKWVTGTFHDDKGRSCANGWCGISYYDGAWRTTKESEGLASVFSVLSNMPIYDLQNNYSNIAAHINNGTDQRYQQLSPKRRILAALYDIKGRIQPELSDVYISEESVERELVEEVK